MKRPQTEHPRSSTDRKSGASDAPVAAENQTLSVKTPTAVDGGEVPVPVPEDPVAKPRRRVRRHQRQRLEGTGTGW